MERGCGEGKEVELAMMRVRFWAHSMELGIYMLHPNLNLYEFEFGRPNLNELK